MAASWGTVDAYEWSDDFEPAAVGDYEIFTPMCWEPDIINTTGETRDFQVQAALGTGELSKVHTLEAVPPGERMHLHLFHYAWENNLIQELAATADSLGCDLIIKTRRTDQPVGADS